MNRSGSLSCRWPEYVSRKKGGKLQHRFKGSGKVVATTKRAQSAVERVSKAKTTLADEKAKVRQEAEERALRLKRLEAMRENPEASVGAIKEDKSGQPYVSTRNKGKFGPRVKL